MNAAHAATLDSTARYSAGDRSQRGLASDVWRYRELLRGLIVRNLTVRYQRSVLGFLWALLNPLLTIALLVGVFGFIFRIQVPSYWAFLLSGYFAWVFILHTLGTSITILQEHASMMKGASFPSEILVFSAAGARLIEFAAELLLVAITLSLFHHGRIPASLVLLPVVVVLQLLLTLGLALPAAAASVFFRDVQHGIPVLLSLLAYLSPVYYPPSMVPQSLQGVYRLNPLAGLLELYHTILYEGRFPSVAAFAGVAAASVFVFAVGLAIFRKHRNLLAEIV